MPKYYFHVHDRLGVINDDEGMELADMDEVKAEAIQSAREMLAEGKKLGVLGLDRMIAVKDADGKTVLTLHFEDAVLRDALPPIQRG